MRIFGKIDNLPNTGKPGRFNRHAVWHYMADGRVVAQKWPRRRPRAELNPTTAAQVARWDMAQEWVKIPLPSELAIASERTMATAFYTRDLLVSSMYGNTIAWPGHGWAPNGPAG